MKFVLLFLLLATATTSAAQSQRTQQYKGGLGIRPQTEKTADTRSKSKQTATELPELMTCQVTPHKSLPLRFRQTGTWLATGISDSTVRIWQVSSAGRTSNN